MKSFLSLLSEIREMRASQKCYPGFGCGIKPRSSSIEGVCATDAPLHIHIVLQKWFLIKPGGLDLSRRDLDRDPDLDAKKVSVSTVSKS